MSSKKDQSSTLKTLEGLKQKSIKTLRAKANQFKRVITRPYYTEKLISACYVNAYKSVQVREAVENGADINVIHPENNQSLLMLATRREDLDMMKFSLEHGAKIDLKNSDGRTALMYAMAKKPEIATWLIENGADINAQTYDGRYVLDWAALFGRDDQVKRLLDRKAKFSDYAILSSVINGHTRSVKLLLNAGANVHAENSRGKKILVIAAKGGFVSMMDELLKYEHDTQTIYQALQMAMKYGYSQTITILKKALKREQDKPQAELMNITQLKKGRSSR